MYNHPMHPINDIRGSKGHSLKNKRIVLAITGSIAAVETVRLARELARHGAEVIPVMSGAATRIIHPDSIHFATGHSPIIELDGAVKHVELCGDSGGRADLLLVAPATANTISKIAAGIDDTPVTTMATCALGSKMPVIIVPAMHGSMYNHKIVLANIKKLEKLGVRFLQPRFEENKAKIANNEHIIRETIRLIGPGDLKKNKVLVITGSTSESIDDVRSVTNFSSGETGIQIALAADLRGARVEVWAPESLDIPQYIERKSFKTTADIMKLVPGAKADIIIVPAAISDFAPVAKKGKISSDAKTLEIKMTRNPKVLVELRKHEKSKIIGFKLESGISRAELEKRARARMRETSADIMVANLKEDVGPERTKATIIRANGGTTEFKGTKSGLANVILDVATES